MTVTVIYKMNILTEVNDKEIVISFVTMLIANFLIDDNNSSLRLSRSYLVHQFSKRMAEKMSMCVNNIQFVDNQMHIDHIESDCMHFNTHIA